MKYEIIHYHYNKETGELEETVTEKEEEGSFGFSTTTDFPIERLKKNKQENKNENEIQENKKEESKDQKKLKFVLENIKPSEYQNINIEKFKEYLEIKEDLTKEFWEKIENSMQEEENLYQVFLRTRETLDNLYGEKKDTAKSLSDSRFTSLKEMIERGMISCGSYAKIFGTALRKFGIPVKFIHGIFEEQKNLPILLEDRHAWLEFYNPQDKNWVPIDFTEGSLEPRPTAIKIKEYTNWDEEFKKDYENGNF